MTSTHHDLTEILEQTRPPDPELVDLIEQAFLEGQIDVQKADLAYLWLLGLKGEKVGTFVGINTH
jgi:hypothetical protein